MSPYLHQTQNRIRIRSDFIQRHPRQVAETIARVQALEGIVEITHRTYAGSVAIRFDSKLISGSELLRKLESEGWLAVQKDRDYIDTSIRTGTRSLVKSLAMLTLNLAVKGPLVRKVALALVR